MENKVRIVPMNGDHLDQVAELERICFSVPWSRNMLAEELENDLSAFLVALDGEEPPKGDCGKAAAGFSRFCTGSSPGVFDIGGAGFQLRCHRALWQPRLSKCGAAETLL